jgi:hypothetical protein
MPEPAKRTIKIKPILADLRAGMEPPALKSKYGLSDRELNAVLNKLAGMGALPRSDRADKQAPDRRPSGAASGRSSEPSDAGPREWQDSPGPAIQTPVRCPICHAEKETLSAPCPQCGALQSRSLLRDSPGMPVPEGDRRHVARVSRPSQTRSSNPWVTIGITTVIFFVIGVGLLAVSSHRTTVTSSRPSSLSTSGSEGIKRITASNFQTDVVEASRTKPILIEFYADW